mgnify:CR=1 FL=1
MAGVWRIDVLVDFKRAVLALEYEVAVCFLVSGDFLSVPRGELPSAGNLVEAQLWGGVVILPGAEAEIILSANAREMPSEARTGSTLVVISGIDGKPSERTLNVNYELSTRQRYS